jgi:hypothetical protein
MNHDVFISYSSKESHIAETLCKILEENEIKCWIAPRDIPSSQNYGQCIVDAIEGSKVFVVIFTQNSNQSKYVAAEIERAFHYGIPIFPFRLDVIPPSRQLEFFLSTKQWQDVQIPPSLEIHVLRLGNNINRHLGRSDLGIVVPTRPVEEIPQVRRFLTYIDDQELIDRYLENLAQAAHQVYCRVREEEGWSHGALDEADKQKCQLKSYYELSELGKEAKRAKVRYYPAMLAALGYRLIEADLKAPPFMFPGDILEELAELEHSIYRLRKLEEGFRPGQANQENAKLLPNLVEWENLKEHIKSINRGLVWEMQTIIAQAGYKAEKVE